MKCRLNQEVERMSLSINFGKGDRYRPVDPEKFNRNYDEIFRKNKKEKENDRKDKRSN